MPFLRKHFKYSLILAALALFMVSGMSAFAQAVGTTGTVPGAALPTNSSSNGFTTFTGTTGSTGSNSTFTNSATFSNGQSTFSGGGSSLLGGLGTSIAGAVLGCLTSSALASLATTLVSVPVANTVIQTATGGTYTKQCYLDAVAKGIANGVLNALTQATVNWINSGFNGGPAFVQNPGQFFASIAFNQYNGYIGGSSLGFLNTNNGSIAQQAVQLGIQQAFLAQRNLQFSEQPQPSTINNNFQNPSQYDQFVGASGPADFSQGGWSGWLALTQDNNNPYSHYVNANTQLNENIGSAVGTEQQVLSYGNGYQSQTDANGNIITPGALVAQTASKVFGNTFDQLNLAKSFDDIINALVNTAMNALITKGLSGIH